MKTECDKICATCPQPQQISCSAQIAVRNQDFLFSLMQRIEALEKKEEVKLLTPVSNVVSDNVISSSVQPSGAGGSDDKD